MTDKERQREMDFIIGSLARITASTEAQAQANTDAHTQHTTRLDRLERVAKLMISAGMRARRQMREQDTRINALIDSQVHTEEISRRNSEKMAVLIDTTSQLAEIVRQLAGGQSGNSKL